jgi:hypothetical protein
VTRGRPSCFCDYQWPTVRYKRSGRYAVLHAEINAVDRRELEPDERLTNKCGCDRERLVEPGRCRSRGSDKFKSTECDDVQSLMDNVMEAVEVLEFSDRGATGYDRCTQSQVKACWSYERSISLVFKPVRVGG